MCGTLPYRGAVACQWETMTGMGRWGAGGSAFWTNNKFGDWKFKRRIDYDDDDEDEDEKKRTLRYDRMRKTRDGY